MKADYARLKELGVRGWYDELRRLRELSIKHEVGLHADDPKVETHNVAGNPHVFLPGAPVVQFVEALPDDAILPKHLLPALVINISAPDEIIRVEFERGVGRLRGKNTPTFREARSACAEQFLLRARILKLGKLENCSTRRLASVARDISSTAKESLSE